MLLWATEAANAAGWRVVCRGMLCVVLKARCRGGWDARVLVACRAGVVIAEGHMQRSLSLPPRLSGRRRVFCARTSSRSSCGPWLYWLLCGHFGSHLVVAAPPTSERGMPLPLPMLTRAAGMVTRGPVEVDVVNANMWRVAVRGVGVYIQLNGRQAQALGDTIAANLDLASDYDATKTPPWAGYINSAGLALWVFNMLQEALGSRPRDAVRVKDMQFSRVASSNP